MCVCIILHTYIFCVYICNITHTYMHTRTYIQNGTFKVLQAVNFEICIIMKYVLVKDILHRNYLN